MKVKTLSLLAGAGSLLVAGAASADFLGLEVIDFSNYFSGTGDGPASWNFGGSTTGQHPNANVRAAHAASGVSTFRIYGVFDAADIVFAVGGVPGSVNALGGSIFNETFEYYGDITHFNFAPGATDIQANPNRAFDTFVSVGLHVNDTATGGFPSNAEFGNQTNNLGYQSSSFGWTDSGWFITPDDALQGTAGTGQQGLVDDGHLRVLLGQVSVAPGAGGGEIVGIAGNLGLLGVQFGGQGDVLPILEGLDFASSVIPAPGALALLGLAGLAGVRRRRA